LKAVTSPLATLASNKQQRTSKMPEPNQTRTQVDALQEIITKQGATEYLSASRGSSNSCQVVAIRTPQGVTVKSLKPFLDEYLTAPEYRKGTAHAFDLDSFIRMIMRHKDDSSVVFCKPDRKTPSMTAVLNYNELGADGKPRFGDHRVHYQFPLSDEWRAWAEHDDQWMTLEDFAEFIEDRVLDVIDPIEIGDAVKATLAKIDCAPAGPAQVMSLSRGMKIKVDRNVAQVVNLKSGESQVNFEETHRGQDGGNLIVPGACVIGIPVFLNGTRFQLVARLRYRTDGGSIEWKYVVHRSDLVFDYAVNEAAATVAKETQCALFMGQQEA
jgi:uncharacterized protein YfdQ (DUF2303 family)